MLCIANVVGDRRTFSGSIDHGDHGVSRSGESKSILDSVKLRGLRGYYSLDDVEFLLISRELTRMLR